MKYLKPVKYIEKFPVCCETEIKKNKIDLIYNFNYKKNSNYEYKIKIYAKGQQFFIIIQFFY
jgi:hypothetical protein